MRKEADGMRLDKAHRMLEIEYEKAKKKAWVHNPLAYALHKVWRMADAEKTTEKGGAE